MLTTCNLLTLSSCSLRVANRFPAANLLLLLKWLLSLLHNISQNSAASRMTVSNLAVCNGPNLLSPSKGHLLPLELLVEVTERYTVFISQLQPCGPVKGLLFRGTLLPALLSKSLWSSFLREQHHSCSFLFKSKGQEWERLFGLVSATWVETNGLMCAGEGAVGVSPRGLQGNLWAEDGWPSNIPQPRSLQHPLPAPQIG